MERNGVLLDSKLLAVQSRELGERCWHWKQRAYELAGQPFNLNSPKQIQEILFDTARPAGQEKNPRRRALHRRGSAARTGAGLPAAANSCSNTAAWPN